MKRTKSIDALQLAPFFIVVQRVEAFIPLTELLRRVSKKKKSLQLRKMWISFHRNVLQYHLKYYFNS